MEQLICEACGSKDLIKQDDVFVCQHCKTKYFAKKEKKDSVIFNISGSANVNISEINSNIYIHTSSSQDFFETENETSSQDFFETKNEKDNFNWITLFFISLFLGWLGADRFFVGKIVSGIVKLLIALIFVITYLAGNPNDIFVTIIALFTIMVWWLLDLYDIIKGKFAGFRRN